MAFSCVTRSIFSILPLLLLLLLLLSITPLSSSSLSPRHKVTKELLDKLCSKPPISNQFCIAWLTSDPTTFTLDLQGLLGMVLEKTDSFGSKNLEMMKELARTTTIPKLKFPYGSCVTDYELSITAIEGAKEFARSMDYKLAYQAASKAIDSISSCEADLEGLQNVPPYVPPRNLWFDRMCTIGQVLTTVFTS